MSRLKILMALLVMAWFPHLAKATCTYGTTDGQEPRYQMTVTSGATSFDPNAFSIGQTIFTAVMPAVYSNYRSSPAWNCTQFPSSSLVYSYTWRGVVSTTFIKGAASGGIYPTVLNGIGVRMSSTGCTPTGNLPLSGTFGNLSPGFNAVCPLTIAVIKTGAITSGGTLSGIVAGAYASDGTPLTTWWMGDGGIPVNPRNPTCAVNVPSQINVNLGSASRSSFGGVGTTATGTTPASFNIGVNCGAGSAGTQTAIYVTLTDQNNQGNTSDILPLDPSSTASGVGVRIFSGATAVKFGPDSATVGNTNQWRVATVMAAGGAVNIPLTATFVQTASTVTPGTVKAYATFTMAYQ